LLRVVTVAGAVVFPVALIAVVLLMSPPLGSWAGLAALALTAVTMQTRTRSSWWLLLTLVVLSMALSLALAPAISEGSFANGAYLFVGAAALAVDTYGMVRLVQLEGALLKTRRQTVTLAALRERTRVARDVHDLLGLGITTIVLKAELAARLLHTDPDRARNHLDEARRLVQNAAEAAGAITSAAADSKASNASLTTEAHGAKCALASAGIAVELHLAPVSHSTDSVLAVVLREAINNVLRHSTATSVRVALSTCDDQAFFSVENDGAGQAPAAPGRGLQNITSRVAEAGGRADVSHGDGRFCLTITMPV
jgi:two-component system sensor histidine kinase DesK